MKEAPAQDRTWISKETFKRMRKKTEAQREGKSKEMKKVGKAVR